MVRSSKRVKSCERNTGGRLHLRARGRAQSRPREEMGPRGMEEDCSSSYLWPITGHPGTQWFKTTSCSTPNPENRVYAEPGWAVPLVLAWRSVGVPLPSTRSSLCALSRPSAVFLSQGQRVGARKPAVRETARKGIRLPEA